MTNRHTLSPRTTIAYLNDEKKEPPIPEGLDDGHVHEVVDRLHVIICTIEEHVTSHPLVEAIPSIKDKIDQAVALLADAYQETGRVGLEIQKGVI